MTMDWIRENKVSEEEPLVPEWTNNAFKAARLVSKPAGELEKLVDRLLALPAAIEQVELATEIFRQRAKTADESLDLREAELAIGIAGANAQERKTGLLIALASDGEYFQRAAALQNLEGLLAAKTIEAEKLRRESQAIRTIIELRAAQHAR